jgi:hypothetical protein
MNLAEAARWLQVKGQRSICLASDVLETRDGDAGAGGAAGHRLAGESPGG